MNIILSMETLLNCEMIWLGNVYMGWETVIEVNEYLFAIPIGVRSLFRP